jgi:hypothetical protein
MTNSFSQRDALLIVKGDYSSAAGTSYSKVFDLGEISERGVRIDPFEILISAPALTATNLPASNALSYSLQFSDTAGFLEDVTEVSAGTEWSQTGSASGTDALQKRFRIASNGKRYVRVKCVRTGTGGNLTDLNFAAEIVT